MGCGWASNGNTFILYLRLAELALIFKYPSKSCRAQIQQKKPRLGEFTMVLQPIRLILVRLLFLFRSFSIFFFGLSSFFFIFFLGRLPFFLYFFLGHLPFLWRCYFSFSKKIRSSSIFFIFFEVVFHFLFFF